MSEFISVGETTHFFYFCFNAYNIFILASFSSFHIHIFLLIILCLLPVSVYLLLQQLMLDLICAAVKFRRESWVPIVKITTINGLSTTIVQAISKSTQMDLKGHHHPSPSTLGPRIRILAMEMSLAIIIDIIISIIIITTTHVSVSVDPLQPHILPQVNALNRHHPIHFHVPLLIGWLVVLIILMIVQLKAAQQLKHANLW